MRYIQGANRVSKIQATKFRQADPYNEDEWSGIKRALRLDKCEDCGAKNHLQRHHKIPRAKGGRNEVQNLVVLCDYCHSLRHPDNKAMQRR